MACMPGNYECPNENFGESLELTNWILYSGAKCHIMSEVSDFISGSLEDIDRHIQVTDRHHFTAKQKGQV